MIRILVTAFGAFPGAPVNPTMRIAAALRKRRRYFRLRGIEIETLVLPVVEGTRERLQDAVRRLKPDVILHLGLAGRRRTITVETRALNRLTLLHVDAGKRRAGAITVEKGAPPVRRARYAPVRLARTMSQARAPARLSIDAGDYLCNQTLYLSLGLHQGLCGFIHVPRPRVLLRPRRAGNLAIRRPTISEMVRAFEHALQQLAADHRLASRRGPT